MQNLKAMIEIPVAWHCKTESLRSSGLQDSISDPPPPGGAEVWSRDAAQVEPRLAHLLIVSHLVALQGFQSENPLRDLETSRDEATDQENAPQTNDKLRPS